MKFSTLVFSALLLCTSCFAAPPKTEQEFIAAVREAFESKDPTKVDAITWEKGASENDIKKADGFLLMMMKRDDAIDTLTMEPLPAEFKMVQIGFGKRVEPTCQPAGMVKIAYKSKNNSTLATETPYAVIDGVYYLVGVKSTDLQWKGPPDKALMVNINGTGPDKVKIHIKYNASGIDLEEDTKPRGFVCQYISEIVVTSDDPDTDITLSITEGMNKIYESGPLKGKGSLVYKKPN